MNWIPRLTLSLMLSLAAPLALAAGVGDRASESPAGVPTVHDGLHHRVDQSASSDTRDWMQPPHRESGAPAGASTPDRTGNPALDNRSNRLTTPGQPSLGHSGGPELGRAPPLGGVHPLRHEPHD